ncbi:hypothetical protein EVAR_92201_1 [Eumeta japonica]|uniref:Uncharacterized protein n=1 Tax=Eumeta variegata TaxID=151549 RepID=A0A4C1TL18_EUMVA|nr:hypothetical protein EVAR_92201_1 [Eumeta japonica]
MNDDELISRRKKQNADRVRAYGKRKKDLGAMASTGAVQSENGRSRYLPHLLVHLALRSDCWITVRNNSVPSAPAPPQPQEGTR